MSLRPPLFIAGPTAVGKSAVALRLAELWDGEIISVDSMQVYRGLDLGTAKPTLEERRRVPHHLIDVLDLAESFDAAAFVRLATAAVADIQSRGRLPIFCGGTGLYFKAYLSGLGAAPPSDAAVRAELEARPLAELVQELAERDPETYAVIDRQNPRRVVRAMEVIRLTGRPFSAQRAEWVAGPTAAAAAGALIGLQRAPAELQARIDMRVDEMFRRGLVAETARLLPLGLAQNRTALQAIGYRQVAEHVRGERSLGETVELVKIRTRQFARRQRNWFQRQLAPTWLTVPPGASPDWVCAQLERR